MDNFACIDPDCVTPRLRDLAACCVVAAALGLTSCGQQPASPDGDEPESWNSVPIHFSNLQVLPETIGRDELILNMRTISRSLGVRCAHCHEMLTEDYASDDMDAKIFARDMMRMVRDFNELTSQRPDATAVTCYMCHRGAAKPPSDDFLLHPEA
jgi:hypothetical protein